MIDPHSVGPGFHWKQAYDHVERHARAELEALPSQSRLTTTELVARLYDGQDKFVRDRVFKALKTLAAHKLADYWTPGPPMAVYDRTVRYKMWHNGWPNKRDELRQEIQNTGDC